MGSFALSTSEMSMHLGTPIFLSLLIEAASEAAFIYFFTLSESILNECLF